MGGRKIPEPDNPGKETSHSNGDTSIQYAQQPQNSRVYAKKYPLAKSLSKKVAIATNKKDPEPLVTPKKTDPIEDLFSLDKNDGETPQDEKDARRREFLEKRHKILLEKAEKERAEEEVAARGYRPPPLQIGTQPEEQGTAQPPHDSPYAQAAAGNPNASNGVISNPFERVAISIPESSPYTTGMSEDLGEFIKEISQKRHGENFGRVYKTKGIHEEHMDAKARQIAYKGSSDTIKSRNFWIMMVVFTAWISVTLLILWGKGII